MKAASPHTTRLSARQTHQFIVVTYGLLVCVWGTRPINQDAISAATANLLSEGVRSDQEAPR